MSGWGGKLGGCQVEGVLPLKAAADGAPGVVEGRVGERGGGDLHDTTV